MSSSIPCLIVGGGLSGLLAVKTLLRHDVACVGVEKGDRLGGLALSGHHRLYEVNSVQFFEDLLSSIEWARIDEPAQERKKGGWHQAQSDVEEEEKWLLGSPFYFPKHGFLDVISALTSEVGANFELKKEIISISPERHVVVFQDGSEMPYEKIIWCSDLHALLKVWEGEKTTSIKHAKGSKEVAGGINLDWELSAPVLPTRNTIVFPFRYKDKKLRALGSEEESRDGKRTARWIVYLDEDIVDDREVVAKVIRALKRELHKEFPELAQLVLNERIIYLPSFIAGATPSIKSLEIFPGVFYLGAQARLSTSKDELQGVDRVLENLREIEQTFKGAP